MTTTSKTIPDQHRALLAQLADVVRQPMDTGLDAHAQPTATAEQALRLAGLALALLMKHRPDQRGDCTRCQPPPKAGWRALLPHRSRNPCLVWKAARLFLLTDPAVATWQALRLTGQPQELADVRAWISSVGQEGNTARC